MVGIYATESVGLLKCLLVRTGRSVTIYDACKIRKDDDGGCKSMNRLERQTSRLDQNATRGIENGVLPCRKPTCSDGLLFLRPRYR